MFQAVKAKNLPCAYVLFEGRYMYIPPSIVCHSFSDVCLGLTNCLLTNLLRRLDSISCCDNARPLSAHLFIFIIVRKTGYCAWSLGVNHTTTSIPSVPPITTADHLAPHSSATRLHHSTLHCTQLSYESVMYSTILLVRMRVSGEQHGFRKAENVQKALDGEFYFFAKVFGYEPADKNIQVSAC